MSDGTKVRQGMDVEDVLATDEAKGLLEAGRQNGSLSVDEIAQALDDYEVEPSVLDSFIETLESQEIAVVAAEAVVEEEEPVAHAREISTDSLQLFLKYSG